MYERIEKFGTDVYPTQYFESFHDIINHIESTPDLKSYSMYHKPKLSLREARFMGTSDFEESMTHLKYGIAEVTTRYLDKLKSLKNENGSENTGFFMDIEGCAYDMGAVVAGEPECCINQGAPSLHPHLTIYIDTGYNGEATQTIIDYRGVAIYHLLTNLIARGYILDIYFVHYIDINCGSQKVAQKFRIPTENLVVSQVAFCGTCEFFRAITWLLTAIQIKRKDYDGGSGKSQPSDSAVKAMKEEGLFIPSGYTDTRFYTCNQQKAIELVTDIYNDYIERHNL